MSDLARRASISLWSILHLIANGDLASLIFFACFAVVAAAGMASIDAKRRRLLGAAAWQPFAAQTSTMPFAAILAGRNQLRLNEIGTWRWIAAIVAYALRLGGHAHITGVRPVRSDAALRI